MRYILLTIAALLIVGSAQAQADALTCYPGSPVLLSGGGPTRAAYLLYFGSSAVSGGSVDSAGHWAINLVVGHERPGSYPVVVRVRGARDVLLSTTCHVPSGPAPLPISTPAPTALPNSLYTNGNDTFDCADFDTYDQANNVFVANLQDGDPNKLDSDGDLIPCEDLPGAPQG